MFGAREDACLPGFSFFCPEDCERHSVEEMDVILVKGFQGGRVAVRNPGEFDGSFQFEINAVCRIGPENALPVCDPDLYEKQVFAVVEQRKFLFGDEFNGGGRPCGFLHRGSSKSARTAFPGASF